MFDSSTGPLNLKALGLVWLQFYVLNCLNVMFKVFSILSFNHTGATLNAGLGWLGGGTGLIILRKKYYQKGPWRDRFDNTPKKVLSERSVIQKIMIKKYYQNGRPKKCYQAVLSKRYFILSGRYPTG